MSTLMIVSSLSPSPWGEGFRVSRLQQFDIKNP